MSIRPIALITGGNRGLGRSSVRHLAAAGVDVLLTFRAHQGEADAAVREVEDLGGRAVALPLDLSTTAGVPAFADEVRRVLAETFGRDTIDYLVNNSGTALHKPLAETTAADLDELLAVHVTGPFVLTGALLPVVRDGGKILFTSTGLTRFTLPGHGAYAAAKGAVEVLSRYLALEVGHRGIAVNTIAPGAIQTDFGGGVVRDDPATNQAIAGMTAMGRAGLPDDVGGAVAALLTGGTGWITGQRIEISGGQRL